MDLADIFDRPDDSDKPKVDPKAKEPTSADIAAALDEGGETDPLAMQAETAAIAYDTAKTKEHRYKIRRDQLIEKVNEKLADLKREWDEAKAVSDVAVATLQASMETAKVTEVPMPDRKPIRLKITTGSKKHISQKWLISEFGKQRGNDIWKRVPRNPDKAEVVIPPRFEDEPTD